MAWAMRTSVSERARTPITSANGRRAALVDGVDTVDTVDATAAV